MICPKCHSEIPDDSIFCELCGEKIPVQSPVISVSEPITDSQPQSNSPPVPSPTPMPTAEHAPPVETSVPTPPTEATPAGSESTKKKSLAKTIVLISIALLLILGLSGMSVFLYTQNKDAAQQIDVLKSTIADKDKTISSQKKTISNQKAEISKLERDLKNVRSDFFDSLLELNFYETYAAIVPDNGRKQYHVYGCEDLGDYSFWIYNIDLAKQYGYYACPKCH